jgi:hypothetical protein
MQKEIETLVQTIKADFIRFATRNGREPLTGYFKEKVDNFDDIMEVKYGNKYIKIIKENSVWGFIVNTDTDKKFRKGDILKAAGWNAPARNAARGNIFENYSVAWTGPHYLK